MSSPVRAATEALETHIGSLHPETGEEAEQMFRDFPDFFQAQTAVFSRLADKFGSELPMHPAVVEYTLELANMLAAAGSMSEELYRMHRSSHEQELERIEEPRPGEPMWNVT